MRVTRVHVGVPLTANTRITLPREAAEHIARVLRLRAGAQIVLFDGQGGEYEGRIADIERGIVSVDVGAHQAVERESPLSITLLQALARGEKMDWVVQKATELGVTRIVPIATERSVVQLDAERAAKRVEHWRAVAASACEQCGRNRVPEIAAPAGLEAACAGLTADVELRLLLAPDAREPLAQRAAGARSVAVLIGPEGGLAETEIAAARRHGFEAAGLGPRILRTETAAVAALTALQIVAGDLGDMQGTAAAHGAP